MYFNFFNHNTTLNRYKAFALLLLLSFSFCTYSEEYVKAHSDSINSSTALTTAKHRTLLNEYSAIYQVYYDDDLVGTANETLIFNNGLWKLEMNAQLKKLFFKINSNEFSEFAINNQILRTQKFHSKTQMTFKKDKIIEQEFDWNKKIETGFYKKRSWQLPLQQHVYDRMSHTIQLRLDLINKEASPETNSLENDFEDAFKEVEKQYKVSHKGKREVYTYKSHDIERLSTPYGELAAVKFERVKDNGDKLSIWFSPKLDYFPIKIAQKEKDKPEVSFLLKSFNHAKSETLKKP